MLESFPEMLAKTVEMIPQQQVIGRRFATDTAGNGVK
jgi:hypothetical protein